MNGLILHAGAKAVTREALQSLPAPESKGRFHSPVPHADFVGAVSSQLTRFGLTITKEEFGLSRDGAKLFGVLHLNREVFGVGIRNSLVMGIRSSTDESFAMQGVAGSSVFVCDNLAFRGDSFIFSRKHTTHVRLTITVEKGVQRFLGEAAALDAEIRRLAAVELTDERAARVFAQLAQDEVVPDRYVAQGIRAYFKPEAADTEPRSLWGVHNAVTRTLRPASIATKMEHTQALSRFLAAAA